MVGRTIGLYGDTGCGKTTQAGQYAKHVRLTRAKNSLLFTSDMGGYGSINHLVKAGVIKPIEFGPNDDAWIWIDDAVSGKLITPDIGCVIFDSGTSQSEALLSACSHSDFQIGQQRTQKFTVTRGSGKDARTIQVASNNEAHYGLVQGFMLDSIWKSTWLTRDGIDVVWTFSTHRGEEQDRTPILGPKLAGKALTAALPKWLKYFFRLVAIPQEGSSPRHILELTQQPELAGLGHSFGNARYPIEEGITPLPATIEPASVVEAIRLIENGEREAEELLNKELGN